VIIDNSVLVSLLIGDTSVEAIVDRVRGHELKAPSVVDLEFASALRGLTLARKLDPAEADGAYRRFRTGSPHVARLNQGPLLGRIWELRHNLTPYDAAYVAAAEWLDEPLLTRDGRIARVPNLRCKVDLLP
jgi:predicted nucleic acid-binding protein